MQVILNSDVNKVGSAGALVNVSDGYARNFLFPRGLAVEATAAKKAAWKEDQAHKKAMDTRRREEAELLKNELQDMSVRVEARAGGEGKLFGSVTSAQVSEALEAQYNLTLDKRDIKCGSVRQTGEYPVTLKLYPGVSVRMTLVVTGKDE